MRWLYQGLAIAAVCACVGCNVDRPNWLNPGNIYEQQARATFHDPYGDVNFGPENPGTRPLNYQVPRAQPVKSQWYLDRFGWF